MSNNLFKILLMHACSVFNCAVVAEDDESAFLGTTTGDIVQVSACA
jgi:hypothetical protein